MRVIPAGWELFWTVLAWFFLRILATFFVWGCVILDMQMQGFQSGHLWNFLS